MDQVCSVTECWPLEGEDWRYCRSTRRILHLVSFYYVVAYITETASLWTTQCSQMRAECAESPQNVNNYEAWRQNKFRWKGAWNTISKKMAQVTDCNTIHVFQVLLVLYITVDLKLGIIAFKGVIWAFPG